jgi:hypothetical protein
MNVRGRAGGSDGKGLRLTQAAHVGATTPGLGIAGEDWWLARVGLVFSGGCGVEDRTLPCEHIIW